MGKLSKDIARTYNTSNGSFIKRAVSTLLAPGVRAMIVFRFGQWIDRRNIIIKAFLLPIYFILNQRLKSKWGIQIPKSAQIDEGFYIGHFGGITLASEVKIGKNVNISQLVTIGESGQGEKAGAPTIGDYVYIGAGAKVIGKINIGSNVKIGANAVVYKDIPDNAIVVSYPGYKILSYKGNDPSRIF
ncbi:MAG: serine acetyltransferase [Epsilonproteobacteria bacterium]|nr:serine acetyltransferase [Campylobacterota bacterium]